MSSPQSTTSHEDQSKKNLEQITFRFCAECANMLYPKEDEDSHKLQFTCRTCQYTEEAVSTCVFRNILNNAAGETAGVTQDVGSDPTVGFFSAFGSLGAFGAFVADGSLPNVNPDACVSNPLCSSEKPVLCFCCGGLITCTTCDEVFLAMPRTTTPTAASSTASDDESAATPSTAVYSPAFGALDDMHDYDLDGAADNSLDEWLGRSDDDCRCSLFSGLPDDEFYEFMDGTEYGNGEIDRDAESLAT